MKKAKREKLERAGWRVGSAEDLLELSREEAAFVEMKLALSDSVRRRRQARKLTQTQLAKLVGSSQSRIAKMEAGDPSVSIDLLMKKTFLRAHWGAIAATNFFTVEVVTWRGLVRYFVLVVIDSKSRRVELAGFTAAPNGLWMEQIARNMVDCEGGFLVNTAYLIHDRDPLFTHAFAGTLKRAGVNPVKLPVRSPNLNAYAERFVRSAKSECIDKMIPLGERHLRRVVREYGEHYHREQSHQGIGNLLIDRCNDGLGGTGPIECRERLAGMLRYYAGAAEPSFQFWHTTRTSRRRRGSRAPRGNRKFKPAFRRH